MANCDYSISCGCGYTETSGTTWREAIKDAKEHIAKCSNIKDGVYVDEYNLDEGELSGNYKVIKK